MANHTHEYYFWHTHMHLHGGDLNVGHNEGHYHLWSQTHSHGDGVRPPHTHKDRQAHPDESSVQHHGLADHGNEPEHHPECKLPYYGGGLKGCIDRCEVGKKKDEQ